MELFPAEIKAFPQWDDHFYYKDGLLIRKNDIKGTDKRSGDIVGHCDSHGYLQFQMKGKNYLVHRVIWEMHNGPIPQGYQIDHINHVRTDNRIENLRLVTNLINGKNQSKNKNNTSGVTGITKLKNTGKWQAEITVAGKKKYLGVFDNFDDAVEERKSAELLYAFHANHGKDI